MEKAVLSRIEISLLYPWPCA